MDQCEISVPAATMIGSDSGPVHAASRGVKSLTCIDANDDVALRGAGCKLQYESSTESSLVHPKADI